MNAIGHMALQSIWVWFKMIASHDMFTLKHRSSEKPKHPWFIIVSNPNHGHFSGFCQDQGFAWARNPRKCRIPGVPGVPIGFLGFLGPAPGWWTSPTCGRCCQSSSHHLDPRARRRNRRDRRPGNRQTDNGNGTPRRFMIEIERIENIEIGIEIVRYIHDDTGYLILIWLYH